MKPPSGCKCAWLLSGFGCYLVSAALWLQVDSVMPDQKKCKVVVTHVGPGQQLQVGRIPAGEPLQVATAWSFLM